VIRFENVTKSYDDNTTLRNISFQVRRGEMAYITGPSGAGKTTLLKLISLEEWADDGAIYVDKEDVEEIPEAEVPYYRRKIGIVFQDPEGAGHERAGHKGPCARDPENGEPAPQG
jgi:cell division transport system ATP-binding protein